MWTQHTFQGTNREVPYGWGLAPRLRALEAIGILFALSWYLQGVLFWSILIQNWIKNNILD